VLQTQGTRLYRLKGFLNLEGSEERIVIQGVHMVVDTSALGPWATVRGEHSWCSSAGSWIAKP